MCLPLRHQRLQHNIAVLPGLLLLVLLLLLLLLLLLALQLGYLPTGLLLPLLPAQAAAFVPSTSSTSSVQAVLLLVTWPAQP